MPNFWTPEFRNSDSRHALRALNQHKRHTGQRLRTRHSSVFMGSEASKHVQPADDAGVRGRSPAAGEQGGEQSAPARLIPTPGTFRAEAAGQQRVVVGEQLVGAQAAQALGENAQERNSSVDSSTGRSSLKHSRPALHSDRNKALLMAADVQVCFGASRA